MDVAVVEVTSRVRRRLKRALEDLVEGLRVTFTIV